MKIEQYHDKCGWKEPCLLVPDVLQALAGLRARVRTKVNE
jgi:hypothetical protein